MMADHPLTAGAIILGVLICAAVLAFLARRASRAPYVSPEKDDDGSLWPKKPGF